MKSGKLDVAVTSRASEDNALWMINHLRSQTYRNLLGRVTYLPISNTNQAEWRSEIQKHSFSILYHSRHHGRINLTDVTDSLYDHELQELSQMLGRDNVMVVVDDLLKSNEEEKERILNHQPSLSIWAAQVVLFAEKEKTPIARDKQQILLQTFQRGTQDSRPPQTLSDHQTSYYSLLPAEATQREREREQGEGEKSEGENEQGIMKFLWTGVSVGIFSWDDESSYQWLAGYLSTIPHVQNIYPIYVASESPLSFKEATRRCTFAILYHTKNRGRINVTDVTDSLYDWELKYLSAVTGKENVIVLIDDLEDDGDSGQRTRILQSQPSLQQLAAAVICFTREDKMILTRNYPAPETEAKLRRIREMIGK
ncbi:hypothetical protein PRIEUP_LOCUS422, partial [Pristimantis euphronides]